MSTAPPSPYLRTKVLTASPAELRLMLLDGAIKHLEQGTRGLEDRDFEAAYNGISRCQGIVMELLDGLSPQHAPDLCRQLSELYTFIYTQLVKACTERDPAIAREMLKLLRYEHETWTLLLSRLAEENASGAASASEVADGLTDAAPPRTIDGTHPAGLVGGHISVSG